MAARKHKWHPPPPPSPKIPHLPRRTCRQSRAVKAVAVKVISGVGEHENNLGPRGRLESLFDRERTFSRSISVILLNASDGDDRDRGEESGSRQSGAEADGEEWKFQAEFLRAECNFLRMEKKVALKNLKRNRIQMEKMLQTAWQTLILGRKKMFEGKNAGTDLLEEEIEELEENLEELQKNFRVRGYETQRCCNFDKKASILCRRIEKLEMIAEEKKCVREIREMAEASLRIESSCYRSENHVSLNRRSQLAYMIRRKMEGLSKGMLEQMEEYGNLLGTSSSSSASTSRRTEFSETETPQQERRGEEKGRCGWRCKAIVKKIAEQVRSETEQWSQMQVMLGQVRAQMEELQASRDLWQNRAIESHDRLLAVQNNVNTFTIHEWRHRAQLSETKVSELEKEVSRLQVELERLRNADRKDSTTAEIPQDIENAWGAARMKGLDRVTDSQKEKEKRVLVCCRLKEKPRQKEEDGDQRKRACSSCGTLPKRLPLQELGNSSLSRRRQSSASVFPTDSPHPTNAERGD
ncbi:uncharacterized protein [Aristolochia californica]|uniref:uncharacterized protein n=1 Tax=Aristolochia californica TaxID=171875 RepID=UPI0035E2D71F